MPPLPPLDIGSLCHRVQLQRSDNDQQADAGLSPDFKTYKTVWGRVESMTVNQIMQARQTFSNVSTKVVVRFRPGIQPNDRAVWGNRIMGVKGVLDPDGNQTELHLMCEELSNGS